MSSLVLQNVPIKYGPCYYYACGKKVGARNRMCLKELDEDALVIINVRNEAPLAIKVRKVSHFLLVLNRIKILL